MKRMLMTVVFFCGCASNVERHPSATRGSRPQPDLRIDVGEAFEGRDDVNRTCQVRVLQIDRTGPGVRLQLGMYFPNIDKKRAWDFWTVWVSHPMSIDMSGSTNFDRSVLRTEDSSSPGEVKLYLTPHQRPHSLAFYSRIPDSPNRRNCDGLRKVEPEQERSYRRRRPASFGPVDAI